MKLTLQYSTYQIKHVTTIYFLSLKLIIWYCRFLLLTFNLRKKCHKHYIWRNLVYSKDQLLEKVRSDCLCSDCWNTVCTKGLKLACVTFAEQLLLQAATIGWWLRLKCILTVGHVEYNHSLRVIPDQARL